MVYADGGALYWVTPGGQQIYIPTLGLNGIARPSLSPDATKAVVQASESSGSDLNIYVVDLFTGRSQRISFLPVNEESPEWFPNANRIAYMSFSPTAGIQTHIYDVDAQREVLVINDGYIHAAISKDSRRLLNTNRMRIYDTTTGALVSDLRDKVMAAIAGLGYQPDTRYPGQANLGTFPLDADFSPDGQSIVFDGAVQGSGQYGVVIFRMTIAGDNVTPLTDLIAVDPARSNNHNYSQLNPAWR